MTFTYFIKKNVLIAAKVFLGSLSLNRTFNPNMANKMSKEFQQTAGKIEEEVRD